jgi:hypothetical protein
LISVRSEVQIFPGPPAFARASEAKAAAPEPERAKAGDCCVRASARQASLSLRLESAAEQGAIAQLGERLLCKQEVVGSIPSGSTSRVAANPPHRAFRSKREVARLSIGSSGSEYLRPVGIERCGLGGLSDIVKRRSLRAFGRDENLARRAISSIKRNAHREWKHSLMNMARDACRSMLDRRGRRYDLEASWSF